MNYTKDGRLKPLVVENRELKHRNRVLSTMVILILLNKNLQEKEIIHVPDSASMICALREPPENGSPKHLL